MFSTLRSVELGLSVEKHGNALPHAADAFRIQFRRNDLFAVSCAGSTSPSGATIMEFPAKRSPSSPPQRLQATTYI